ncbi:MAG: CinA family protein [Alphaproteobacteria bacterium]|nr:CinA family protein [Alphaproteobacteria bacterium]
MTTIETLATCLLHRGWMLVTAESCTGGLVAARCTDLAGSSLWLERGFVTYSNEAKHEMLGVDTQLIETHGAVSEEVARAMALGALRHSRAQVSVALTGVAGPGGGSRGKPVGKVWVAWATPSDSGPTLGADTAFVKTQRCLFTGDRAAVRLASVEHAIQGLIALLK